MSTHSWSQKSFVSELNPSQLAAVEYDGGHLLIVAGPGTGKTHTLTCRIARFCQTLPNEERILAITFTNRAAQEMRERLATRVSDPEKKIFAGTFHQFCLSVLRDNWEAAGLPRDFKVAAPEEIENLLRGLWPDKKSRERRVFLEEVSAWKAVRFLEKPPKQIESFRQYLRSQSTLDFDDLLLETVMLLSKNAVVTQNLQAVYRRIFVDEYQDINPAQHAFLKILAGVRNEVTAIGDPNQAIYGFRGSDVKYFAAFPQDFWGAKVLQLEENYRSARNILAASAQVMAEGSHGFVPALVARIYEEGRLTIQESASDKAEAEYVVHQIEKMVGGTSMFSRDSGRVEHSADGVLGFGDVAVLYRLNSQRRALVEAFSRSGMPFFVAGQIKDEEDEEIADDLYFSRDRETPVAADKVMLMTIHAAKGLEFSAVFITGCEQNILPLDMEGMSADSNEERRLFYVGMTRAKQWLFLTRAQKRVLYGKVRQNAASPFLLDIEEELKEHDRASGKPRKKKNNQQMELF